MANYLQIIPVTPSYLENWPSDLLSLSVHLAVACDVYDGVFLCCPFSHEVSWMRS